LMQDLAPLDNWLLPTFYSLSDKYSLVFYW
jgi:hypothetical protein